MNYHIESDAACLSCDRFHMLAKVRSIGVNGLSRAWLKLSSTTSRRPDLNLTISLHDSHPERCNSIFRLSF